MKLTNEKWLDHPWSKNGLVQHIDVHFLQSICNQKSTDHTDLLSGEIVHQDKVWENIKKEGMQEPLLIVIGYRNKTIRLESGNHRIKTAIEDGYTHLPCAVQVIQREFLEEGNGTHFYDAKDIIHWEKLVKCPYPYQINPLEIIKKDIF